MLWQFHSLCPNTASIIEGAISRQSPLSPKVGWTRQGTFRWWRSKLLLFSFALFVSAKCVVLLLTGLSFRKSESIHGYGVRRDETYDETRVDNSTKAQPIENSIHMIRVAWKGAWCLSFLRGRTGVFDTAVIIKNENLPPFPQLFSVLTLGTMHECGVKPVKECLGDEKVSPIEPTDRSTDSMASCSFEHRWIHAAERSSGSWWGRW